MKFLIGCLIGSALYAVFFFIFLGFSQMSKAAEAAKPKEKIVYNIEIKDSVVAGKFYRHVIVDKNGWIITVKDCAATEALVLFEKQACNKDRKTF